MFLPDVIVQPMDSKYNTRLICNYLHPDKAKNTTRPFAEKTYAMYPELQGKLDGLHEDDRNAMIQQAVETRLLEASEEIISRVEYFKRKFDSYLPDYIHAQCDLFNYSWKEIHPQINCYVGYIPFYPRSAKYKWFYVSYHDEERVFSGAVHEINHMIFYEKWKQMHNLADMDEPSFPSALWFLEEIIVDPTLNDPSVKGHTLFENKAYEQFYSQMICDKSIMEHIKSMYQEKTSIEDFISTAYAFIQEHEFELVNK